jgi:hypothetical protein
VLAEAAATITVTLRSNVDLFSSASIASKITLSGLKGSKTIDTTSMSTLLAGGDGNVATAFSPSFSAVTWTQSSGVLVLQLASGICEYPSGKDAKSAPVTCIKAGIEYVFAITLTNGADVQEAPPGLPHPPARPPFMDGWLRRPPGPQPPRGSGRPNDKRQLTRKQPPAA